MMFYFSTYEISKSLNGEEKQRKTKDDWEDMNEIENE